MSPPGDEGEAVLSRSGLPGLRVGNEWAEERLAALLDAPRTGVA